MPGAVRSWGDARERFGQLDRGAILAPAIEFARDGFPAWDDFIDAVEATTGILDAERVDGRAFADTYRPNERPWRPGEVVRLPRLAATLERLVDDGFEAFYDGDLAARQCVALAAAGSEIKEADFAAHRSTCSVASSVRPKAIVSALGQNARQRDFRKQFARVTHIPSAAHSGDWRDGQWCGRSRRDSAVARCARTRGCGVRGVQPVVQAVPGALFVHRPGADRRAAGRRLVGVAPLARQFGELQMIRV